MSFIKLHRVKVSPKQMQEIAKNNKESLFKWKKSSSPYGEFTLNNKTVGIETTGFPPNFQQYYRYKIYFFCRPKDLPWNKKKKKCSK